MPNIETSSANEASRQGMKMCISVSQAIETEHFGHWGYGECREPSLRVWQINFIQVYRLQGRRNLQRS